VLIVCALGSAAVVHIVVRWGYAVMGSHLVWALLAAAALWVAYRAVIVAFARVADFPG
jgi:4-hydroxybenzoate polyprenyltransferase